MMNALTAWGTVLAMTMLSAGPVAAQPQKKKQQSARNDVSLRSRSLQEQARDLSGGPITAYAPVRDSSAIAPVPVANGRGLN